MIQVANNVTSKTVGNTTSGISLTFDSNGVITSAANVTLSVANTQLTGTITATQLAANSVNSTIIAANTISNTNIQTGAIENYSRATGILSGMRNRIINGAMVIDQRNAGASVTPANGGFGTDRWKFTLSQASKLTSQQSTTAPTGFNNSLLITSSSAYSIGSGDYFAVYQNIEGFNFADCGFGTANAKTVTLSFWVRSSLTGTFGGSLTNSAQDRCYPFSYTISSANTYEYKTVTIAGDTTGTWVGATNGTGASVWFGLGVGSTYSGTAGAWNSTSFCISATGATSVVGTNGATFYITGVQLEVGSTATSFDYRSYGTELQLCQRYLPAYQLSGGQNVCVISSYSSGNWITAFPTIVPPRVPATGVVYTGTITNTIVYHSGTGIAATGISFNGGTNSTVSFNIGTAAATVGVAGLWATQSASATLYFTGCEL